ncbi:MAG TPA: TlpA disulfide reductase family protein [Bryobacteraceae bacterium]|jgi:thiol-disulfide isomerase/thioredoxin
MSKLLVSFLALSLAAVTPLGAQQVPRKTGDWTIQVPGGRPLSLAAYKGKPVLLAFILTTCPHCQHAVEILNKLQPEYARRGLVILASAIDQNAPSAVPLFLNYMHPPFPVGYDDPIAVLNFAGYSLSRLPQMPILLFIDRQGMVREQHDGADAVYLGDQEEQNLRKSMDALLARPKPAPRKAAPPKAAPTKPQP